MMDLYSEDIELLKELYSKDKIEFYFFHEKYKLSPAQLARALRKFSEKELIEIENNLVILTKKGREWIFHNRLKLFLSEKSKYWKNIPEEMKQDSLAINELYLPVKKNIDKELFKNIEDGK